MLFNGVLHNSFESHTLFSVRIQIIRIGIRGEGVQIVSGDIVF